MRVGLAPRPRMNIRVNESFLNRTSARNSSEDGNYRTGWIAAPKLLQVHWELIHSTWV
jgi:hypothetical protein